MASVSGRKRRRHRWDSSRLRIALTVWCALATVAGLLLTAWGGWARIDRLFYVGLGFLGTAIVAGLCHETIVLVEWIRARWRDRRVNAGFALLMALALLALLTGPVVHGLTLAQVRLSQARRQRDQLVLRAAAADAFCRQVEALVSRDGATARLTSTPGGVEVQSEARSLDRPLRPLALQGVTGDVWEISSRAAVPNRQFDINGYALRSGSGSARILIWLEQGLYEP